jgi:hypothetical protein
MKCALLVTLLVVNGTASWAQMPNDLPIDAKQREAVDYPVAASHALKTEHRLALHHLVQTQPHSARVGMWHQAIDELFPETKSAAK